MTTVIPAHAGIHRRATETYDYRHSRACGNPSQGNRDFKRLFTVGRILESDKISNVPFFWF